MSIKNESPQILAQARTASGIAFQVRKDPRGTLNAPEFDNVLVSIHLGTPAHISCRRAGKQFRGRAVHGDIDIIPARTSSLWQMHDENDSALLLSFPTSFLQTVANDAGVDEKRFEILNRFQVRDSTLENLSWAIKCEMEMGCPSGRLYLDGLALSFASRLVTQHSSIATRSGDGDELKGIRLKNVLSYIEEQLASDLRLEDIARVAGVGTSYLQTLFRNAIGMTVYRYVIQRRVERARDLLANGELSLADVADASGFADQSHMARHIRRVLNSSPQSLRQKIVGPFRQSSSART
jgi:AraC family transcriptional regulator